jgi:hypothetical protein
MGSTDVKTYSPDEVTIAIASQLIDSGFAAGEFLSIERGSERFKTVFGADGEAARSKILNRSALVKVKLLQTSLGNDRLAALVALGESGVNGADVSDVVIRDLAGNMVCRGDKAWVEKEPVVSRGAEITECEWTIMIPHADFTPGGNPSI